MSRRRWKRTAPWALAFVLLAAFTYRPLFVGRIPAGVDTFQLGFPDATFLLECLRHHELPLWTPYERLGQPFAATLQSQAFYLPRLVAAVLFGPYLGIALEHLFHALLAAGGIFVACRMMGRSRMASFLGGAAFGLGPLYAQLAHVPNISGASGWSGAMLAAGLWVDRERSPRAAAALAVCAAGSLLCGSPETWLWEVMVLVLAARRRGWLLRLFQQGGALAFAFVLSALVVVPTLELTAHSSRMGTLQDALVWSATPSQVLAMVWLLADLPATAADQPFLGCMFQGTVIALLAVLALRRSGPARRLLLLGLALALLALGERFAPARLVLSVPPFSLFRYPSKYLVGTSFCVCIAAARGLDLLRAQLRRPPSMPLRAALMLLGLLFITGGLQKGVTHLGLREGAARGSGWMAVVLLAVAAAYCLRGQRGRLVAGGVLGLALLELQYVTSHWASPLWMPVARLAAPSVLRGLLPAPTEARISVEVSNERRWTAWASPQELIGVSRDNLLPLRNVEEQVAVAEGYGPPEPRYYDQALDASPRALFDLAGVTRFLTLGRAPYPGLTLLREGKPLLTVFASSTGLPRAYLSHETRLATDAEALNAFKQVPLPFRKTTLLAHGEALSTPACPEPAPRWTTHDANTVALTAAPCSTAYLVVTDSHFPGWLAWLDGKPVPLERANLFVRAVKVPPGQHEVVMRYRPLSFRGGSAVSLVGFLGLVWSARRRRWGRLRA